MKKGRKRRALPKIRLDGDPILTTVCEPVAGGDTAGVICDMMHILTNSKTGVGLSANQAGYDMRIIILKVNNFNYVPMINPVIESHSVGKIKAEESCLSYPGKHKDIYRFNFITVSYTTPNGDRIEQDFENLNARIIQHEIDHLNGKCIVGT